MILVLVGLPQLQNSAMTRKKANRHGCFIKNKITKEKLNYYQQKI